MIDLEARLHVEGHTPSPKSWQLGGRHDIDPRLRDLVRDSGFTAEKWRAAQQILYGATFYANEVPTEKQFDVFNQLLQAMRSAS